MELRTGMRVQHGDRRGTVLGVDHGVVKVAWDDGITSHKTTTELGVLGKDAVRR